MWKEARYLLQEKGKLQKNMCNGLPLGKRQRSVGCVVCVHTSARAYVMYPT